jgi:cyclopropane fatty-acyl-phospholipid synthase-like methyltransferase
MDKFIHEHGFWLKEKGFIHSFDEKLALAIFKFLKREKAKTIVDFGCGRGEYLKYLMEKGFFCEGYDGNPKTPKMTKGLAKVLDLAVFQDLKRKFDWVISLEVGEHIDKKYQDIFIENLVLHCKRGIIISWAIPGQGGQGHCNEKSNEDVRKCFEKRGFFSDLEEEKIFRKKAKMDYFKKTLMVLRKK